MRRLFDEQPIDFGSTISMEAGSMIHVQKLDDPWRVKGLDLMTRMRDYLVDNGTENGKKFFYSPEGMAFHKELTDLVEERFGFRCKMLLLNIPNACMGLMHMPGINVFEKQISLRETPEEIADCIRDFFLMPSATIELIKSKNKFKELSKKYNITVDLKNAKVSGLPKETVFMLGFNAPGLFNTVGITPEEALGIVTHEIGHAFTHLSVAYRDIINTTVLLNTFTENIEQKNKSSKDSLILSYSKVYKADANKLKSINNNEALGVAILQDAIEINHSGYASIDSEQQADQFAGRFGLGADAVSGTEKLAYKTNTDKGWLLTKHNFILELIRCIVHGAPITFASLIMPIPYMFLAFSAAAPIIEIGSQLFDQPVMDAHSYDTGKLRQTRAYHELVRQLRTTDDPEIKDFLLEKISLIDKLAMIHLPQLLYMPMQSPIPGELTHVFPVLEALTIPFGMIATNAYHLFIPGVRRKVKMREIERLIESLDATKLHVAGAKIDQYLRKN